jgi:hypothetical protein
MKYIQWLVYRIPCFLDANVGDYMSGKDKQMSDPHIEPAFGHYFRQLVP